MDYFKINKKTLLLKKNQFTKVDRVLKKKLLSTEIIVLKFVLKPKVCSFAMHFAMLITSCDFYV